MSNYGDTIQARPATTDEIVALAAAQPPATVPLAPDGKARPRVTVAGSVYHQIPGETPLQADIRYARWLDSDQDPYSRTRMPVGEQWQPIESGWIEKPGMIIVTNRRDQPGMTPTATEREAAEARVIEVGIVVDLNRSAAQRTMHDPRVPVVVVPLFVIRLGESQQWTPAPGSMPAYRLRCVAGEAKASVVVLPC